MSLKAKRPSKQDDVKNKLLKQVVSEDTSRLNADIEKSLYRQIKMKCIEEDKTISALTRKLWIEYLSK